MAETITEKILAAHCGQRQVQPGDIVRVRVDFTLAHDVTAPPAIAEFRRLGVDRVWDPDRIALVADHFVPAKDIASATNAKIMREFAREQAIKYHFEGGNVGIEHPLLLEQGLVGPGEVVIGAESHTCTYGALGCFATGVGHTDAAVAWATGQVWMKVPHSLKIRVVGQLPKWVCGKDVVLHIIGRIGVEGGNYLSIEYEGDGLADLTMEDRFTMASMTTEVQSKVGLFPFDERTRDFVRGRLKRPYTIYQADPDASYLDTLEVNLSSLEPQVAVPFLPSNAKAVRDVAGIMVDQALIGTCTNGWLSDLRTAAAVMRGRKVHPSVRCIVIPSTPTIYRQAIREGIIEALMEAGCFISGPTCGPCPGAHMGVLAAGERCISTSNRNFRGRMGHVESEVYLTSPAVAAASAIVGSIAHPEEVA